MAVMNQMNKYNRYNDNGVVDLFVFHAKRDRATYKNRTKNANAHLAHLQAQTH